MSAKIFFSYAHEDEALLRQLQKHLEPLWQENLIDAWYERDISTATEWAQKIDPHIDTAHIILLLVSQYSLNSDYFYSSEIRRVIERHDRGEAQVFPILLRPVYYQRLPFAKLLALPTNAKPVVTWSDVDEALLDIVTGIRIAAINAQVSSAGESRRSGEKSLRKPRKLQTKIEIMDLAYTLQIRKKNNQGMVLFLGARAGSLFHSQAFCEILKNYSTSNFDTLSPAEQFAECYKVLRKGRFGEKEIDIILTSSLQYTAVPEAHTCVAELIKEGVFDIVVSTNIDNHLEEALKELGMKEQYDFSVFLPERESLEQFLFSETRPSCQIIKTFGDLPSRGYTITKRDFSLDAIQGMTKYLEHILARDVLVIGFDPIWDAEMLRVFPVSKNLLWLVTEEEVSVKHPFWSLARHGRPIKSITGKLGGFESFFKALYWQLYGRIVTSDQLVREAFDEFHIVRNQLRQLEKAYNQMQEEINLIKGDIQEYLHLKENSTNSLEKKGEDNSQ